MKAVLTLGAVVAVLGVMGAGIFLGLRQISPTTGTSELPDGVAIMVVGSQERVEVFRDSIDAQLIVADTPGAFALDRGRIIAAQIEAGSVLLNQLGWADRPLEIIDPRSTGGVARSATPAGSEIAALAKKKTLTPAEALRALQLMR